MAVSYQAGTGLLLVSNADPGVSEINILLGCFWYNSTSGNFFICKDRTLGAQVWKKVGIQTISVDTGGTGATTLTGVLTGNGTSAVTANAVTQHGVLLGGASNAVSSLGVGSTGTVLVGSTGADPSFTSTPSVTSITIGTPTITSGAGAPSSSQPKGSLYLRTDGGGVNDRMYVATDAVGGWTAVVTVA